MSLGLKDLIVHTRKELDAAHNFRERQGELPIAYLKSIAIEASFMVEESSTSEGGLDFKIVSVGKDITVNQTQIHKVKLELEVPYHITPFKPIAPMAPPD